ncbi:hypothetical protein [Amycolatopsis sp. GM8]|uniref:hypothetical protein n=1 Tax=Amycolatopsis sp. GM8 TaxID=2896530 RepID=UPI001F40CF57|nr:hypothetical protein [Amycolatopsis sp. GM8]
MGEPYKVDLDVIDQVRGLIEDAEKHYATVLANCEQATGGLQLKGGRGETGAYQAQLSEFATQWGNALASFLRDEHTFVTFLDDMRTNLGHAHSLYRQHEAKATDTLNELSRQLDELGR